MLLNMRAQNGAMLAEVMLGMMILVAITAYMTREQIVMVRTVDASNVASGMKTVQAAAKSYIEINYNAILAAAHDGTGANTLCVVNASPTTGTGGSAANNTTKHTCAFDVNWLKYKGFLNASFKNTTSNNSKWAVVVRRVYDGGTPTSNMDMLVVPASSLNGVSVGSTTKAIKIGSYEKAATLAGTAAGIIPDAVGHPCGWHATDNAQRYVCGVQGAWKAKLSDFLN